jgi:hypothetical protein
MKNTTTTIMFITLVYYSDSTFYYTIFTDLEIFNQIFNNTLESFIPNISQIEIPKFKEPFDIFKPTVLDTIKNNNNFNISLDIIIEQVKAPRIYFVLQKLN